MERRDIGTDDSEVLDYEPGGFRVLLFRRARAVADCDCAGTPAFVIAPAADRVIDGGLPGPGLLARVVVSKFVDHIPYERQAGIYKREGVEIAPSTLVDWGAAGALMLTALAERIRELALLAFLVQSDDTGLTVLDRDHPKGRKRGHIWVYVGDKKWAAFVYTPDWKADGPTEFLESRVGPVQVDGYGGYKRTFQRPNAKAWEVGCWMHCRRYWKKALDARDLRAAVALEHIARLYEVERAADESGASVEERLRMRQEYSRPAYDQLGRWVRDLRGREPPKTLLGRAITYTVNHWIALGRFLEDGRLPLDNGESERQLRKVALGRANYLFAGSDDGGKRAATFYTVVGTCLLNGVDPFAYLRDVFAKIAAGWPSTRLDELLPPNWAAAQQQAQQEARPA